MKVKRISIAVLILGILLILSAAIMTAVLQIGKAKAEIYVPEVLNRIEAVLPERTAGVTEERTDNTMPALEMDGRDYIGILELPEKSIKLPVSADWDRFGISYRPARFSGSIYDGTLILGGYDTAESFGFISELDGGEKLTFTDMNGRVFAFTVDKIRHSDNAKVETLSADSYGLTLFVKKDGLFLIVQCGE